MEGLGLVNKLGKSNILSKQLSELSGGWRVRATLASILIQASHADVLLLDEPSNHCKFEISVILLYHLQCPMLVDIKTVRWLIGYLTENMSHLILVVVSHDR